MEVDVKEFGQYLRDLRKKKAVSTHKLAELSGVSQSYISHLEGGRKTGLPSPDILKKLAAGLGIPHVILMSRAGYVDATYVSRSLDAGLTLIDLFQGMILINEELQFTGTLSEILHDEIHKFAEKYGQDIQNFFGFIKDILNKLESRKDDIVEYETFYEQHEESLQDIKSLINLATAIRNKRTEQNELRTFLLHQPGPITYNGHELTDSDRTRILIMMEQLFPQYAPEQQPEEDVEE